MSSSSRHGYPVRYCTLAPLLLLLLLLLLQCCWGRLRTRGIEVPSVRRVQGVPAAPVLEETETETERVGRPMRERA